MVPRPLPQVPENTNIFGDKMNSNIIVTDVKTSAKQIQMGSTAHFCHACVKGGKRLVMALIFAVV